MCDQILDIIALQPQVAFGVAQQHAATGFARRHFGTARSRREEGVDHVRPIDAALVSGNRKLKESPSRLAAGRPQPPTMSFDNRAAYREAHAHAVGLGRVEGFKETR